MFVLGNLYDIFSGNKYIEVIYDKPDRNGDYEAYTGMLENCSNKLLCKRILYLDNSNAFLHVVIEKY